jgi:hypothetical protein
VRDLRPTALDQLGLVGAVAEFAHGFDDASSSTSSSRPDSHSCGRRGRGLPHRHRGAHQRRPPRRGGPVLAAHRRPRRRRDRGRRRRCRPAARPRPSASAWPRHAQRAAELGGTVTVGPRSPHGTRLRVLLPAALPMSEHSERMARAAESGD